MNGENRLQWSRWAIFAALAVVVSIPIIYSDSITLPEPGAFKVVKNLYDKIESLPEGAPVLLSIDFDPSAEGELSPMTLALLRHCFHRNLRVIGMTIWGAQAPPLMERLFKKVADEYKKVDGADYAILPFKPGGGAVLLLISRDLFLAFPQDHEKKATRDLPVMNGIKNLRDIQLVVDIAAGTTIDSWITYGKEKAKMPLAAGCTAVMATDYYPYLQSKQLVGLLGGLNTAYQYESLIDKQDKARDGMKAQTFIHLFLILLIIVGNVVYFIGKRRKGTS